MAATDERKVIVIPEGTVCDPADLQRQRID